MRKFEIALFILSFLYGCESVTQDEELLKYNVVCLLSNLESPQKVYIFKTANLSEAQYWFYRVPRQWEFNYADFIRSYVVKDARVRILSEDSVFIFKYASIDSLCYSEDGEKISIESGKVYKLNIETADGFLISGETKVPGKIEILEPKNGDTVKAIKNQLNQVSVKIKWTKSEDAYGYLINYGLDYHFTVDTGLNFIFNIPQDEREAVIKVLAVDENFYKHYYYKINKSGLRNAYGFFGSCFGDSVTIKIVPD